MTAEWMLTDEEIEDIENEYPRQYGIGITTANAQAKKLLEYQIETAKSNLGGNLQIAVITWLKSMLKQLEEK